MNDVLCPVPLPRRSNCAFSERPRFEASPVWCCAEPSVYRDCASGDWARMRYWTGRRGGGVAVGLKCPACDHVYVSIVNLAKGDELRADGCYPCPLCGHQGALTGRDSRVRMGGYL